MMATLPVLGAGRVGRQQRDLVAVAHGHAENVVRRRLGIAAGDVGGGGHGRDRGDLLLLHQVQPGQHVAGIDAAQHGVDLDVVDKLVGVLDGLGRGAHVVALDDDHLLAKHAAAGVQVVGRLTRASQREMPKSAEPVADISLFRPILMSSASAAPWRRRAPRPARILIFWGKVRIACCLLPGCPGKWGWAVQDRLIRSAALLPIIMEGQMLAEGMDGITDESTMRSLPMPCTRSCGSTTAYLSSAWPMRAVPLT